MTRFILAAALCVGLANEAAPAVFTVGPGGSYADLPSAWQALAASDPGSHELRLASGTFALTQSLALTVSDGSTVEISGSWDAGFQARSGDRSLTQISGAGTHRLMELAATGGQLRLAHLSLSHGSVDGLGGLVTASIGGTAQFLIQNVGFSDGAAIGTSGCMSLAAADSSTVLLSDVSFSQCRVNGNLQWGRERGSALILEARHAARVRIEGLVAHDNLTEVTDYHSIAGTAVELTADDTVNLSMENFDIRDNRAIQVGMYANPTAGLLVSAPWLNLNGTPEVDIRRGRLRGNVCEACSNSRQFMVMQTSGARVRVSDTLIANGHSALSVLTDAFATVVPEFINLTVTHHTNLGISVQANPIAVPAPTLASLSNSVLSDNAEELSSNGIIESTHNLIGTNPQFVNAAAGDFRPADLSPLIDAGSNSAGQLGARDLDGMPRIDGPAVDIGAYEWRPGSPLYGSGFE